MSTLGEITQKYQVDQTRDHYPLNTIRLLYLILIETLVDQPQAIGQTMLQALPLIRETLDKRTEVRLSGQPKNLNLEMEAVAPTLASLKKLLPNTNLELTIEHLFAFVLPIQENVLFGLVSRAQSADKIFSDQDVTATLNLRSMDSLLYSQVLCDLIKQPQHNLSLHSLVNQVYQINDLLDALVFAEQDTADNNFSAFEVIRKAVPDSASAKTLIKNNLRILLAEVNQVALPEPTMQLVREFLDQLVGVLGPEFLTEATPESPPAPAQD